jgi:superfamily I DNA and/or RNA helicase
MATSRTQTEPAHSILYNPKSLINLTNPNVEDVYSIVESCLNNSLNDSQSQVFKSTFTDRVTLLWGPPGTGKTTVLAGIVLGWIENAQIDNMPLSICVGSSNWTAIDNLLIEISKLVNLRIGKVGDFNIEVEINRIRSGMSEIFQYNGINDLIIGDNETIKLSKQLESPNKCIVVGSTWKQLYNLTKGGDWRAAAHPQKWFNLLLIDEASQVKVSHAASYFLLLKESANIVFAGDDKQLGPIFGFQMEDHSGGLFDCIYTYMKETHDIVPKQIIDNYRSNDHITSWPNKRFYENKLNAIYSQKRLAVNLPNQKPIGWPEGLLWDDSYLEILNPELPIVVLTYPPQTFTVFNPFEAQIVSALACLFRISFYNSIDDTKFYEEHLGIVTPHRAQRSYIQNLLTKFSGISANSSIVVDTVDRFQGQERDLIIASYTVADKDFVISEEAFILDPRRFNVSLTRAKSKFIMLISDSILEHLPSDKKTATDAAHIQLFVEKYCTTINDITLSYIDIKGEIIAIQCKLKSLMGSVI